MAPLAQTLALLAMAMATTAVDVFPLDMAPDSFDDQYRGCGPAMKEALPALNSSEFEQNKEFAEVWVKAAAEWQSRGPPESPLSPDQATAIMAFTMTDPRKFNDALRVVGHSRQEYRDNFHFKTLHFLLTDALATLRDAQNGQCRDAFLMVCGTRFEAQRGDTIRFGLFVPMFPSKQIGECPGETMLEVHTCHGVDVTPFSEHPEPKIVLIPPFETFNVTQYTQEGDKTQIQLQSAGTYSKYNCEWLQERQCSGDGPCSVPRTPFHLSRLLLATAALAWPLPTMALLALTLALLAMTVTTAAIKVVPLDMAQDSFDDQYWSCGHTMTAALPALSHFECSLCTS
uniref:erythroblast NAD(P)(+)--arginine ADP-ribosyltransferase-like n=1 Tax=Agelaius phoeniceus TaxID=39638 RepID=UPI0023ED1E3C|nr:erythroblast NAD(P)(+)--arginine ADP-ribosyltransferase-like [Agelaius phoeniceus]